MNPNNQGLPLSSLGKIEVKLEAVILDPGILDVFQDFWFGAHTCCREEKAGYQQKDATMWLKHI
jgi:hypothetical protein